MSEISETEIKSMTKEQNYMRGYEDGKSDVLDKIKTEIEQIEINGHIRDVECFSAGINTVLNVIDKYKVESEDKLYCMKPEDVIDEKRARAAMEYPDNEYDKDDNDHLYY